jgi:hypothetical protein
VSAERVEAAMDATGGRCGTYAGYQTHGREGTTPCTPCRRANRAYIQEYRKRPGIADKQARESAARSRALWRLADLHPAQFQILVDEEMGR